MQISPINNTLSFGHCKGINCLGEFSKNNPDHIIAINEFLESNAIKQFGEKYDFIANFKYLPRQTLLDWDGCIYKIDLVPVPEQKDYSRKNLLSRLLNNIFHKTQNTKDTKEETPKIPNLPTDIRIITSSSDYHTDAYKTLMDNLKDLSFFELNSLLEKKLEKNKLELEQFQEKMAKAEEALININASHVPIH